MLGYSLDNQTAIIALLSLLILSIFTILACQRDRIKSVPINEFLFSGKTFGYSLVSNIGGMFAVSTYFGAVFMYSTVFGPWSFAIAATAFVLAYTILIKMLRRIESALPQEELTGGITNILLATMNRTMSARGFGTFTRMLGAIYFCLVTVEIAVARVVLGALFPHHTILPALLVGIICIVVFAYLYIGGFKAVLNSDHLQSYVLFAFMGVLLYLAMKSRHPAPLASMSVHLPVPQFLVAIAINTLLLTIWLTMSIDLFSRMNIKTHRSRISIDRVRLIRVSLGGMLLLVLLGIVFANAAAPQIAH